jgi:diaminopimelate decarboxylase
LEKYFPNATTVSFGGGIKEARMPDETPADIFDLGEFAKQQITLFYEKTGRKLHMEVEPGTFVIANTGYIINTIIDKKSTGKDGFNFLLTDGGMDVNTRPAMYASRHPFYLVSSNGELISSEFEGGKSWESIVVGSCCESGDSQTLAEGGLTVPREMNEPEVGDWLIIGGAGAYCSAMSPFNYNSHTQAPEVLLQRDGSLEIIRKPQTLEQIVINE